MTTTNSLHWRMNAVPKNARYPDETLQQRPCFAGAFIKAVDECMGWIQVEYPLYIGSLIVMRDRLSASIDADYPHPPIISNRNVLCGLCGIDEKKKKEYWFNIDLIKAVLIVMIIIIIIIIIIIVRNNCPM